MVGVLILAGKCCAAETGCGLDARNLQNQPLPSVSADQMPAALATELRHGYERMGRAHGRAESARLLRDVMAQSKHRYPCVDALVFFAQGEIALATQLTEAPPLFHQSEAILREVGTPLALAYVHERIAATEHLGGDNAAFLRDDPEVQKELHEAGDEAASILERSMAIQYADNGQRPEAQQALLHALEAVHTENVTAVRGFVEWQAGSSLRRSGRYGEILALFQASLKDLTLCDCEQKTRAAVLLTMAVAVAGSNDADAVLSYASQADAIYRAQDMETMRPQALRTIAEGYALQHDWAKAIATYQESLDLAWEKHAAFSLASTTEELAAAYGDSGNPQKGLEVLQKEDPEKLTPEQHCSARSRQSILESQAHLYREAIADTNAVLQECKGLIQPSDIAVLRYRSADAELQAGHLEEAAAQAKESVRITESQRQRLASNDRVLRLYNEKNEAVYSVWIAALIHLDRPEEALLASEQHRARAFVDLANSRQQGTAAIASSASPRQEAAAMPDRSVTSEGAAGQLRSVAHPFDLTMEQMRTSLDQTRSTLVSYWLSEDGHLYTWVMAPGHAVRAYERPVDRVQLASLIKATLPVEQRGARRSGSVVATRGGGTAQVSAGTRRPWQELYKILIEPIAADLPQDAGSLLTVVPQGILFQLSFPALIDKQQRYLVERYAVSTVPSVGALRVAAKNDEEAAKLAASYVLLANPASYPEVKGRSFAPLPGTELEVRAISHALSGQQVTMLDGRKAGIDNLEQVLPKTTVLHFATHAVVNDAEPSSSYLALDRGQQGGVLRAASVYGLHMSASLVVLSACSTGRGEISGDGVAGLSRAFLYAGAASLVSTLWDVVDEPTARLMPKFYAALARGESRSASLRAAQLGLIDDLRQHRVRVKTLDGASLSLPESPAYWAGFSLSGQP